MKIHDLILPTLALGAAAVLVGPAEQAVGFSKLGGDLSLSQRDWRWRNTFADATANNNIAPHSQYPGALGAPLALWKAASEWASRLHGDGTGTAGHLLGEGGANFDFTYQGEALGAGGNDDNIVSAIPSCGGSTFAFVQGGGGDWTMKFCDNWVWDDGPGNATGGRINIQGIATHEFGHSLGLGHSGTNSAVMKPGTADGDEIRNLFTDDKNGIQCIYGVAAGDKPEITGVVVNGDEITITGTDFDATDNQVWFTNSTLTHWNIDPRVQLFGISSQNGGTEITVCLPGEAGPGDVHVRRSGSAHSDLSNGFPVDFTPNPIDAAAVVENASGANQLCYSSVVPPVVGQNWETFIDLKPGQTQSRIAISLNTNLCHPGGFTPPILNGDELVARPPYLKPHQQSPDGNHVIPVTNDCALLGEQFCTQGFGVSFGPLTFQGFNGLLVTVGNQVP